MKCEIRNVKNVANIKKKKGVILLSSIVEIANEISKKHEN